MPAGLAAALGAKYPDSTVLFDDGPAQFAHGFAGWQELHQSGALPTFAPLSLRNPSVPGPVLAVATRSIADPGLHSQGVMMKRLAYPQAAGIVDFEVTLAFGGESQTGHSPRYIQLMIDEMRGGVRHFWKARWRNVNEGDGSRPHDWFLASGAEDNYVATGGASDLPWNGNKGSLSRLKLSIDLAGNRYLALEANQDRFDLTAVAGVTPPGNNGVPAFDDPLFNNGLNFMVAVLNRGAQPYYSWVACTRLRGIYRSA